MEGDVQETAIGKLSKAISGGMSKTERNQRYFGQPPKGTYFGGNPKDLKHIHDIGLSDAAKKRLYGVGGGRESTVGEVVEARLGTDSRSDLVRELAEQTSLTRAEAETLVAKWMVSNNLTEVQDEVLGKIIVPRGSR